MSAPTLERVARPARKTPARRLRPAAPSWSPDLLLSTGRLLPESTRVALERQFDENLAEVRIHDDEGAAQLADAAGAAAFVLGSHVFFAAGRYDVSTEPGRRLLTHEVAHVVQNRRGGLTPGELVTCREDEAEQVAARDWPTPDPAPQKLRTEADEAATVAPAVELPALRYSDHAGTGGDGTVRVVDLVLRMITRTLRADPEDRAGRIRAQLARLTPDVQDAVLGLARQSLPASDYTRIEQLLDRPDPAGAAISTPEVGADPDDVAAAEQPAEEHSPPDATKHTHADGTTHTHADGTTHSHGAEGKPAQETKQSTGLLGFLFGGSPLAALFGGAKKELAEPEAKHEPGTPRTKRPDDAAGKAGPARPEQDQDAEGKPAGVTVMTEPSTEADKDGRGAKPSTAPETEGPNPRVSAPEAARAEVAAAAGSAAAPTAAPPASEEAQAQQPSAEQAQTEAEDASVLQADAQAQEHAEPTPEAAGVETAPEHEPPAGPEPAEPGPAMDAEAAGAPASSATTTQVAPVEAPAAPEATPDTAEPAVPEATAPNTPDVVGAEGAAEASGPEAATPEADGPEGAAPDGAAPEAAGTEAGAPADAAVEPGGAPTGMAACMGGGGAEQKPPAPDPDAPSVACGGGGGGAGGDTPAAPAAPDVSAGTPDAALATVGALPATDMQAALPQVGAAATADVSKQREVQPPTTMQRPSGASKALDVSAPIPHRQTTPYTGATQPDKVTRPAGRPTPAPDLQPTPSPSAKQVTVAVPRLGGDQPLSEADAARVTETIDAVPTSDPELAVDVGDPGAVTLEADADPALVGKQKATLDKQVTDVATKGAQDAAAPLGEADIRPHVPPKTLTAKPDEGASCPGLGKSQGQGGKAASKYPRVAVDAIVAEKSKDQIQAGVAKAGIDFQAARDKRDADSEQARTGAKTKMNAAVEDSNGEQVTLRKNAITKSTELRGEWTGAQRKAVDDANDKSGAAMSRSGTDIEAAKRDADAKAKGHIDNGNKEIRTTREDAESKAGEEKTKAKRKKNGILGWIGSKVASFFDALRSAITGFFDIARKLVRKALAAAKTLAHEAIELGRKAVVGAIRLAGDAIIAVGDVVLAAFPDAREKFRKAVTDVVDTATKKVNDAADALERGIQALLDGLGKALDCALQYLQAGYLLAVDALASVVKAALDAAQQFLDMLAEWAEIIGDIAAAPVSWLKKMGRAAVDGIRNCLWSALKRAVKQWFNDKVEEVIGVGKLILNILLKGCLKFADIARMAWDAIKAALPGILVQLIIEKLVALIVPAGAALSLIIDGLRAGWGAASRILAAFQKFMAFLKSVKSGKGAGAFAELVAAAGVAVLDFISNFLIGRLKGAGKGVGTALKGMAAKIGKALGKVGRAIGRGVKALGRGLVSGAKAGAGLVKRGAAAVVRGAKRVAGAVARGTGNAIVRGAKAVGWAVDPQRLARAIARSRLGQAVGRGWKKSKEFAKRQYDKFKKWREKRKAKKTPKERLKIAVRAIQPSLSSLIDRGVSTARLLLNRAYWKVSYGASVVVSSGEDAEFEVRVNPSKKVAKAFRFTGARLLAAIDKAVARLLARKDVSKAAKSMSAQAGAKPSRPVRVKGPSGWPAAVKTMRSGMMSPDAPSRQHWLVGPGKHRVDEWLPSNARSPGERMVQLIKGRYTPEHADDHSLDKWLTSAGGGKAGSDQRSARALQAAAKGRVPVGMKGHEHDVSRTVMLIYGRESGGRSLRNLALAPMTVDLVAKGKMSWREALNRPGHRLKGKSFLDSKTGGAYPLSFRGAGVSAAYREGDEALRRHLTGANDPRRTPKEVAERTADLQAGAAHLERRELALARKWLRAQNAADGGMNFRDATHAENWVYEHLLKAYGMVHEVDKAGKR